MLADAHMHYFSYPFFEALASQSPHAGSVDERLARVAQQTGLEVPSPDGEVHLNRWLGTLDAHQVDHGVVFASLPQESDAVAAAVAGAGGRLTGYALVNPKAPGAVEATRAHFESRGFRGILLFPAMHHVKPTDAAFREVLEVVEAHRGVAVVHCGMLQVKLRDLLGLARPFDLAYANPLDLIPAANAHPGVHFVIPHFGAGFFRECLMAGTMCENIYVDTSSSNSWRATQAQPLSLETVFGRALDVFGPDRILFGTDSSTFPRGWRDDLWTAQREALAALKVPAADQAAILGGNLMRLLGH